MKLDFVLQPWQFLVLIIIAGWLNRNQQAQMEFLADQVRILLEIHGNKRILLNDDQR